MESLALYIHVPFCVRKCSYCDFNAFSGLGDLTGRYVEAVKTEILRSDQRGRKVSTIFFGGGTPTYLAADEMISILDTARSAFDVEEKAEITTEANPTTVDASKFAELRRAGFNRLSIGVQAFDDRLLKLVDREHSASGAEAAVQTARDAGFEIVSIDLMYGLPGQSLDDWHRTLDRAIILQTEHISAYNLTIEPGTRFERLHAGGKLDLPDEETEITMFETAVERLTHAGFEHYEVSNYAKPGFQSRHNLVYWRNEEYAGFGPGAVSYIDGRRWTNEMHPAGYVRAVSEGRDLTVESESLPPAASLAETLIQGLRLRDGVALPSLASRFGNQLVSALEPTLKSLSSDGLLEHKAGHLVLTHRGMLLSNDVALALLP